MKNISKIIRISNSHIFLLLSFLIPFLIRIIPEILMGEFIVGFDTLNYYIPETIKLINSFNIFEFFGLAPLFYVLLKFLTISGLPLTISLKIMPPILHGLLALMIYLYARKRFTWSKPKSLATSFLATLYFVSLRISWDMLRSELALIFLFIFLILIGNKRDRNLKDQLFLSIISVLIVFTHQFVSIIMFSIIIAILLKEISNRNYSSISKFVLVMTPSIIFFCLIIYSNLITKQFSIISSFSGYEGEGWLSLFGFSSYLGMTSNILSFILYCYVFLFPFVVIGFRDLRSIELKVWVCWCLIAIFSPIISPNAFIPGGYRWTLILVFPLAFFTIEGLKKFNVKYKKAFVSIMFLLSLSFIILPPTIPFPFFRVFPNYIPSSMLQNSVSINDCEDVVNSISWINDKIGENESLLVHDAFQGWALLFLEYNQIISYEYNDPFQFIQNMENNNEKLFLIWWIPGEGWHGFNNLTDNFKIVFSSRRIAIYEFN